MRKLLVLVLIIFSATINAQVYSDAKDIQPLKVGQTIPEIEVTSFEGDSKLISEVIKKQKTVLLFFRGGWCPYCSNHLAAVGTIKDKILDAGYQVIAVSPDSPEKLRENIDKNNLDYELYSDASTELIQAMGLAIEAPDRYSSVLLDFSEKKNSNVIPVPAVYILNTNGSVLYNYTNPNYKVRLDEKDLLKVLKTLD